jgi:hypothetical protein
MPHSLGRIAPKAENVDNRRLPRRRPKDRIAVGILIYSVSDKVDQIPIA